MDTKRTEILIRQFPPLHTDEAESFGGSNLSPTPLEVLIGALCGCTVTTLTTIAEEMGVALAGIEVDARGHADATRFWAVTTGARIYRQSFCRADIKHQWQIVRSH